MSGNELRQVTKHMLNALLRYAFFGALLLAGLSALMQGVFYLLDQMPQLTTEVFLRTAASWALIGGLFGGILGLVYGLLAARR